MSNEEADYRHWNPTKVQMEAYCEREVQLAMHNLRNIAPAFTLHSVRTIAAAQARTQARTEAG